MCCLNMGLNLKILKMRALHYLRDDIYQDLRARLIILSMLLFTKTLRTVMML